MATSVAPMPSFDRKERREVSPGGFSASSARISVLIRFNRSCSVSDFRRNLSSSDFLFFIIEDLHRHRVRGAANRAQPAADALFVVFDHCRERRSEFDLNAGGLDNALSVARVEIEFVERNELQAILRADVHAAV